MEEEMAARDLLTLNNSLAPRLIRCLYTAALILITVMVVLGVVRGMGIMSRPPLPPAAVATGATAPAAPDATAPPQQGMMGPGMMSRRMGPGMMGPGMMGYGMNRRMMMDRRYGRGPRLFGMGRNPMLAGLFIILGALLRGVIALMIVRILAEIGLAVLAMPRRTET
jgi:hypothetical protein